MILVAKVIAAPHLNDNDIINKEVLHVIGLIRETAFKLFDLGSRLTS